MAGAGAKLFVDGTILDAANINTYLMDQTIMRFASTTARDAAFGGAGEPTLAEGMFAYTMDTNTLWLYDGSAWVSAINAASLNGIGTWTTYTPSWFGSVTNPTIGNGLIGGSYARVNKIVVATGYIIMGSTTTYGSGTYTFGIPVTGLNQIDCRATCALLDASAGYIAYSGTGINATTTTIEFRAGNAQPAMSATVPITLGNGDQFRWYTVYEAL